MLFIDQLGRKIILDEIPGRIVSVVPSQTELLYHLGLKNEVVGITKFCVHPEKWFKTKTRVGGTKKLNMATIHSLKPDLIIGNKEENNREQMEELMREYPVWMSDIKTMGDAKKMMLSVGEMTGKYFTAIKLLKDIDEKFDALSQHIHGKTNGRNAGQPTVAYLVWNDPMMAAGCDTFINEMLAKCGFKNVFTDKKRYPETDIAALTKLNPHFIFLSSEPFPFKEKHAAECRKTFQKVKGVILVDGQMFSWYGSRMAKAASYFEKLVSKLKLSD